MNWQKGEKWTRFLGNHYHRYKARHICRSLYHLMRASLVTWYLILRLNTNANWIILWSFLKTLSSGVLYIANISFLINEIKSKLEYNPFLVQEPQEPYLPDSEIQRVKEKKGFNGLTPTEWASLSKNVWNDLSSPRNKYQLEHGAVFPLKLSDRLIKMYSNENDSILDPFAGIGTTLISAQNLKRHAIGIELNPHFHQVAQNWIEENGGLFADQFYYKLVNDDCRNLQQYIRPERIQLTVTSPPYADFIQKSVKDRKTVHKNSIISKENNSTVKQYSEHEQDFGNLPYVEFLAQIKEVLKANWEVTKYGGYSCWVVKDYRDTKNKIPYVPFHSDLARVGEEAGWKYHDLIVWDQTGQRRLILLGYPSVFYTNQNCSFIVIFRKVK